MARARPVAHDDELTLVEHLGELRSRIFVSLGTFAVAFAVCYWQSGWLIDRAKDPLPADKQDLITFGVAEPFITTLTVVAYGAIILALPVILYQIYAFVLPAFTPAEKRTVRPFALMVPFLFIAGVALGYFAIMPAATSFLLGFNSDELEIMVRAKDYFGFFGLVELAMGLTFQLPIAMLTVIRLGIFSADQIAAQRRFAIVIIAALSAALPGGDPVSMLLIMFPLIGLFELSLLFARLTDPSRKADQPTGTDLVDDDQATPTKKSTPKRATEVDPDQRPSDDAS